MIDLYLTPEQLKTFLDNNDSNAKELLNAAIAAAMHHYHFQHTDAGVFDACSHCGAPFRRHSTIAPTEDPAPKMCPGCRLVTVFFPEHMHAIENLRAPIFVIGGKVCGSTPGVAQIGYVKEESFGVTAGDPKWKTLKTTGAAPSSHEGEEYKAKVLKRIPKEPTYRWTRKEAMQVRTIARKLNNLKLTGAAHERAFEFSAQTVHNTFPRIPLPKCRYQLHRQLVIIRGNYKPKRGY